MTDIMRKKTEVEIFIHTWSVIKIKIKSPNANPNLTHTDTRLQPQTTEFPINSELFVVLLTAKSEIRTRGKNKHC
jgi:hypothetical protein